ncbi:MAG: hypothetical protein J6X84_01960, partial [Treponema sp.]|nr:hypothetical protein [Treponema sp.]
RWMTSYFVNLDNRGGKPSRLLAYEWYYTIPENFNPDWDDYNPVEDNMFYIKDSKVTPMSFSSFVPDNPNAIYMPPDMEVVEEDLGIDWDGEYQVILCRNIFKYGGGCSADATFFVFDESNVLSNFINESASWEGNYYRKTFINFPNACYDVYNNKWVSHTTESIKDHYLVVTVQEMTYENGQNVYSEKEYLPGL